MVPKPVIVTDYDPRWPIWFEELARVYRRALGALVVTVEHVGSTSVPGLAAKPILDIDIVIPSRAVLPDVVAGLAALGYRHQGDRGIPGRDSFARDGDDWPAHHLYVCAADAPALAQHLRFRDWLRTHADGAAAYAQLKRRLAELHRDDRERYTVAKSGFIERALAAGHFIF